MTRDGAITKPHTGNRSLSANHSNSEARFRKARIRAKLSKIAISLTRPHTKKCWLLHFITRSDLGCGQRATLQTIQSSCTQLTVGFVRSRLVWGNWGAGQDPNLGAMQYCRRYRGSG